MVAVNGQEIMQGLTPCEEKIFVSVRLRPLNQKEISRNDVSDWECINDTTIIYRNNLSVSERSMYPAAYTLDRVFRCDCSTRQVYEEGAKKVALSVVSGINASVFAYGQTSSGKTYTMSGITEYSMADIYSYIEKHKEREFLLKFSAMEIYNESVRDLLSADSTPLRLLDDPERGTIVEKLTEETLKDWSHFQELLSVCEAQRQVGETCLNEASSRSHQILRLTIESSAREFLGNDKSSTLAATVNFVDLAGSERASQSLSAGARLKEGCHINRSLLTLGTVIRKLSKGRNGHIPFRDSKLTRILQSSLGGNARTSIICTMSPARSHVEQSRNTLLFASCAKEVATNAQVNVVMSDKALVKHLQRELARLESELRNLGLASVSSDSAVLLREKDLQIEKLKKEIAELSLQRDLAQSEVQDLHRLVVDHKPSTVDACSNYPKLRVRGSWELNSPRSDPQNRADNDYVDVGILTFDSCQYSDQHSRSDSDGHIIHIPDFEENSSLSDPSSQLSIPISPSRRNSICQEDIGEYTDENSEDFCREVRCIELEKPNSNCRGNGGLSSVEKESILDYIVVEEGDDEKEKLGSPTLEETRPLDSVPQDYVEPSAEKPYSMMQEKELPTSGSFKLPRSKSCESGLLNSSSSIEQMEINHSTPPLRYEKDCPGRPEGCQRKFPSLKYGSQENLPSSGSHNSLEDSVDNELQAEIIRTVEKCNSSTASASEIGESIAQQEDQPGQHGGHDIKPNVIAPTKHVKDVGLDPIEDDAEGSSEWFSRFKNLQKEIVKLWKECNVSLVHRSYFFLLFKGDPTDSIYMEVELRRLSFLRDNSARSSQALEDGQKLTAASSVQYLRRERQMLTKQLQKKFTRKDREMLFQTWGIGLNTKRRSLQLTQRLWSDTEDMDHVAKSAEIVAKLVGFIQPEEASKEMFGLNFTPRLSSTKFRKWRSNMMSFM
ncbi:kinesin-like protein KIN-7G isoform X2 [Rhodamnia argentea]|uniref:Kinesin-like protein n=1 Tax=Rhodamnia argentea TaxID=178133 RepID=A0A8B8PA98_9MYRT|nr:kinesin-like protein KIN-7G isoform X2 [Rhodamnia argentea]